MFYKSCKDEIKDIQNIEIQLQQAELDKDNHAITKLVHELPPTVKVLFMEKLETKEPELVVILKNNPAEADDFLSMLEKIETEESMKPFIKK